MCTAKITKYLHSKIYFSTNSDQNYIVYFFRYVYCQNYIATYIMGNRKYKMICEYNDFYMCRIEDAL